MINLFLISFSQLPDPAFRRVIIKAILLSVFVFVFLAIIVWFVLSETNFFTFWLFETFADMLGGFTAIVIAWLLFPTLASFFITLFLEDIVEAVENRHYPGVILEKLNNPSATFIISLRFTTIALLLNILAIPFYFFTIWFPPMGIFVFYCLNGYLLGREYFELVALRHIKMEDIPSIRQSNRWRLFLFGSVTTFLFTIPIINFLAPILGVTGMTHFFRKLPIIKSIQ
ncbi:EI24 domain-containing protein [Betaproteobacteria bacterium]|nr:EI24 domain-containing protein [Betaproteobacteria bacterium]